MSTYSRSHVTDVVLLRNLKTRVAQECTATAEILADIAEIDARKLYLPEGFSSTYAYCVGELHLSEEAAFKRIHAARTARRFPAIFPALAEGRLHLSSVVMLAHHLTPENVDELLAAATHKTKSQIEQLLAQRFPRPDVPTRVQPLALSPVSCPEELSPAIVGQLNPDPADQHAPGRVEAPAPPKVAPLAPERFALQFTIGKDTHDKLRYVQALLSHRLPSGDVAQVFDRALDALMGQLEKQKFAATAKPRPRSRRSSANTRHIPAHVRRAVWQRDQGQCTFVSAAGQRCPSRKLLEFDHVDPVARGGQATVERVRLRCRGHNQYEAERMFGAGFMTHKREEARRAAAARAAAKALAEAEARAEAAAAAEQAKERDVVPWLRALGFRADEARRAAALCENILDAPLEEQVRVALSYFHAKPASHNRAAESHLEISEAERTCGSR